LPLSADHQTIKIFDVSGKLLREVAISPAQSRKEAEMKIPLKGINSGTYFIKFGTGVKKFLIVK